MTLGGPELLIVLAILAVPAAIVALILALVRRSQPPRDLFR